MLGGWCTGGLLSVFALTHTALLHRWGCKVWVCAIGDDLQLGVGSSALPVIHGTWAAVSGRRTARLGARSAPVPNRRNALGEGGSAVCTVIIERGRWMASVRLYRRTTSLRVQRVQDVRRGTPPLSAPWQYHRPAVRQ